MKMECVDGEAGEHFTLPNDVELGFESNDVDIFDDRFLSEFYLMPWSDKTETGDMIDMTDPSISLESAMSENFPHTESSADYPSVHLHPTTEVSDKEMVRVEYESNNGTARQLRNGPASTSNKNESLDSELMKLLKRSKDPAESAPKPSGYQPFAVQSLLSESIQEIASPPSATTETVPIQPAPPVQTQKLVIAPQPSAVQICSIYPRPLEENCTPQALLTIASNPTTQIVSPSASQQLTVTQPPIPVILNTTPTTIPQQFQFVFDPKQLPTAAVVSTSASSCVVNNAVTAPKSERHRAHNAIEQKYRKSINNKITELKNLLFGAEAKIQKSGVLKRAVDHIRQLRNLNSRLRQENASFKIKLQQMGMLRCIKSEDTDSVGSSEFLPDPLSPESLTDAKSPKSSPSSSDDSTCTENGPMFDRTRLVMCILMFSFFVFDPFNFVFTWQQGFMSSSQEGSHHGRSLMAEGLTNTSPSVWKWSIVMFAVGLCLRTFTILVIFLKLFVFGEPSLQPDSKIAGKYWAFRRQADVTLEKGEYLDTSKLLGRCLEILGRPLPTSRLDMTCSLVWHIFRQIVHRLFVTRWLTAKAAKWCSFRRVDEKDIKYRQESAKQAALVYHQLHQLYLKGHVFGSQWLATIVSLNAVNMADMADSSLNEEIRVDIYIDCAIQLRSTLPKNFKFLARYFLSRARKLCRGQSLTLPYSCWWLFTPVGHRFFVSGEWSCKKEAHMWSSSTVTDNKPLGSVTQKFCEFLLEQAMSSLLLSKDHNEHLVNTWSDSVDGNAGGNRALDLLHTMTECVNNSRKSGIHRNVRVFGDITTWPSDAPDLVGCWWAALGKVAACWLLGDLQTAQQQYKIIENMPDEIKTNEDPVGQALLMAFRARSRVLEKSGQSLINVHEILHYCDKGGAFLKESLAFSSCFPQNNGLLKLMQLLCCDWLLSTRTDVWERQKLDGELNLNKASRLDGFSKDLRSLQNVAAYIPDIMPKVYMYQAAYRMMTEANPMKTQRLLQKCVMRQTASLNDERLPCAARECSVSAEKDRANALVMASGHQPTSCYSSNAERKDMIFEAVECLQKFGEKDRIARCRKLLVSC